MGVYLRTSLRAGPFRFNLSRSGIGISVGVPGFRIGTSPRGNYVRLGKSSGYFATTSARARQHGSGMEVAPPRSEEHTSELQSRENLVCRLLLEKKKKIL